MSEASNWQNYFVRVQRYLATHDLKSEELDYKRETGQQLRKIRSIVV